MKKTFIEPQIDLIVLRGADILTTSGNTETHKDDGVSGGNSGGFVNP